MAYQYTCLQEQNIQPGISFIFNRSDPGTLYHRSFQDFRDLILSPQVRLDHPVYRIVGGSFHISL